MGKATRLTFAVAMAAVSANTMMAQQITAPNAGYLGSTSLMAITAANNANFTSVTNGPFTATFSSALNARTVPSGGWSSWSASPFSETATPRVGASVDVSSLTINLSSATTIFGFEAEPDPFSIHLISAAFFRGASMVGTASMNVDGNAGARLFAWQSAGGIDRVQLTTDAPFGLAQFRVGSAASTTTPEPSTYALMLGALAGLGVVTRRRRIVA
ncbi:MAG: PEP-CTERM sorting domain-containing protein [Gemmatimonadaceae bacterium]